MTIRDDLISKIKILNSSIWEQRVGLPEVEKWLENFSASSLSSKEDEDLHALYLLSHFTFYGRREMRELITVLYRDLFRCPIIHEIRRSNSDTRDRALIERLFAQELKKTLFLGIGNPSESGCHLLYYFRQENGLPKSRFVHSHEVFEHKRDSSVVADGRSVTYRSRLRDDSIKHYVFIDDFCGSGTQGKSYSKDIVEDIKALKPDAEVTYLVLCGMEEGLRKVREETQFDRVECVFELDDTFRCLSDESRYFPSAWPETIYRDQVRKMCTHYGGMIMPNCPTGYSDCQLLVGFSHNTPDNSLPIFWCDKGANMNWNPVFRRYPKIYD